MIYLLLDIILYSIPFSFFIGLIKYESFSDDSANKIKSVNSFVRIISFGGFWSYLFFLFSIRVDMIISYHVHINLNMFSYTVFYKNQ